MSPRLMDPRSVIYIFTPMDNVTHTLVGVVLAKAIQPRESLSDQQPSLSWMPLFWTSVVASNLPDADVLINHFGKISKLDYLLHHRGYTHTLLAAIPLGLLSALLIGILFRGPETFKKTVLMILKLLAVGTAAVLLHLSLDFLNDYGVHVFSPFFNRWFYGDILFIVDPYLWLALIPFAFFQLQNRFAKGLWLLLGAVMLAVLWVGPYTSVGTALAVSVWAGSMVFFQRKADSRLSIRLAIISILSVVGVFAVSSSAARTRVQKDAEQLIPQERFHEAVLTPAPANPFCWRVWMKSAEADELAEVTRLGVVSLFPAITSAEKCDPGIDLPRTAQLTLPDLKSSPHIAWKGNSHLERQVVELLKAHSCEFRNFLKFSRVPFVQGQEADAHHEKRLVAGDLRYDRSPDLGFAEIILNQESAADCPEDQVPWEPPSFRRAGSKSDQSN